MLSKSMNTIILGKEKNKMKKPSNMVSHQKRFGQYFSGDKVARLLSLLLPQELHYSSIIDPMAGKGDLLQAVLSKAIPEANILGVEIDKPVSIKCQERLPKVDVLCEDVFQSRAVITEKGWDLVIANPPYVRYQLQNDDSRIMPAKDSIRSNLYTLLNQLPYLKIEEKKMLIQITKNYSGLSDMAVPSWILCAALVKMGGVLAMVVPETWLNREYAKPIQYLLMKTFNVLVVVRDVNACWFDNASIRTCLVVAKKKDAISISDMDDAKTRFIDFSSNLIGENSLIEHLSWNGHIGEKALVNLLRSESNVLGEGFVAETRKTAELFPYMLSAQCKPKWILDEDIYQSSNCIRLPSELSGLLKNEAKQSYITLGDLGVHCGQGLRTGANEFFYLRIVGQTDKAYSLQTKKWFEDGRKIDVSKKLVLRCVQNRRQVSGVVANPDTLETGLLYMPNYMRTQDSMVCTCDAKKRYKKLPNILDDYISAAEKQRNSRGLSFSEYSAVKPNEKKCGSLYERFWYMLPQLTNRHLPNLCITRISSAEADCIYVPQSEENHIVVDANFVTLWSESKRTVNIGLALLNSTWSKCYLELLCTVMGGGALKIEASHVGKILFPKLSDQQLQQLSECGTQIIREKKISQELRANIDNIVLEPFDDIENLIKQIDNLLRRKLNERGA